MAKKKKLTAKEELFCKEYLVDLNGAAAAKRAGYSEKTAKQIATENLSKPYLKEVINKGIEKRSKAVNVTAEYVLTEILEMYKSCKEREKEVTALKALELLGKHLSLFSDTLKVDLPSGHDAMLAYIQKKKDE